MIHIPVGTVPKCLLRTRLPEALGSPLTTHTLHHPLTHRDAFLMSKQGVVDVGSEGKVVMAKVIATGGDM